MGIDALVGNHPGGMGSYPPSSDTWLCLKMGYTHPKWQVFLWERDDQPMDFACHLTHLDEYHLETFMQLYTPKVEHVNVRNAQEEGTEVSWWESSGQWKHMFHQLVHRFPNGLS